MLALGAPIDAPPTSPLDRPRIRVNFNEMIATDVVLLSASDTRIDSTGHEVAISEGLRVYLFEEDVADDGSSTFLIATGVAERNVTSDWSKHVAWRCRIDERGELQRNDTNIV